MESELVDMKNIETTLKDFLRVSWKQETCPNCGAPWNKKKNQCKNKKCAITLEEGKERWVETRYPVLIDLAKLIVLKKMKLKKAKKKLKLSKLNIPKKDLKILAAILAQVQFIDVDWKSIVPLSKIIRSGLIVGATILLWLFLYGLITLNLINIVLTVIVGIIIPSTVGLILRARVNRKVKKAKRAVEEEKTQQESTDEKPHIKDDKAK